MEQQALMQRDLGILVVDDEPFMLAMTVDVLKQLGFHQIETACDGADALRIMQNSAMPFGLVICDLNMPVMDGLGFMRGAQAINYQGALIVLSSEEPRSLIAALELARKCDLAILGALNKPLEPEQLRAMLN